MGRYYYDAKRETDTCHDLSASWLNAHGYFDSWKNGGITWESAWGNKSSIGIISHPMEQPPYLTLRYTVTNGDGSKADFSYPVTLITSPCNFGGLRYWLMCPIPNCGKRVGILYMADGQFGCRHCHKLTYSSQNVGHRLRYLSQCLMGVAMADRLGESIKRNHHGGKPTRKVYRLMRLRYKLHIAGTHVRSKVIL